MTMNWWMEIWMGSWDSMMLYWHWNFQLLGGTWETRPVLKEEEKFQRILPPSTNLPPQIWRSTLDILVRIFSSTTISNNHLPRKPPSEYHLWTKLRIQLQNHLPRCAKWLNHHFVMVEFPPKPTRWSKVSRYPSHCVSCSRMISC